MPADQKTTPCPRCGGSKDDPAMSSRYTPQPCEVCSQPTVKATPTHCPVCALDLRGSTWCSLQKPGCPMPAVAPGDVLDAECERILAMTDAEVLADCRARGEDPEDARRWGLAILDRAMKEVADRATRP